MASTSKNNSRLEKISQFTLKGFNNLSDCEKENGNEKKENGNENTKSTICLYNYEVEFPKYINNIVSKNGYAKSNLNEFNIKMYPFKKNNINNENKIKIQRNLIGLNNILYQSLKNKVFFSKDVIKNNLSKVGNLNESNTNVVNSTGLKVLFN